MWDGSVRPSATSNNGTTQMDPVSVVGSRKPACGSIDVMVQAPARAPVRTDRPDTDEDVDPDVPWVVIVWNDPVNLMTYVVMVLQELFGYPRQKATQLMLDVHFKGRAAVSTGTREKSEFDVARLHAKGLWATMQKDT